MPPAIIAAGIGAAASVGSSVMQSSANKKSAKAQREAEAQQLALQREQYENATRLNAPYNQAGTTALDALLAQLGLGGSSGPQNDYDAYLAANPDVAQRAQQGVAEGLIGPGKQWETPQEWAAYHYENGGKAEGRELPQTAGTPVQGRPDPATPTSFGPIAHPGAAPGFSPGNYQESEEFRVKQKAINRGTNAGYAAKSLLRSGGAIKALQDRTTDNVNLDIGNWFNRELDRYRATLSQYAATSNQFNADRQTTLNQFNNDRGYDANAWDDNIGNLFKLTGIGQSAANNTAAAGSNYANNSGDIFQQGANTQSQYAQAQSGVGQNLFGNLSGIAQDFFTNRAGTSGAPPKTTSPVGYGDDGLPWRHAAPMNIPNNLFQIPNVRF